jgi:hypothetical protein
MVADKVTSGDELVMSVASKHKDWRCSCSLDLSVGRFASLSAKNTAHHIFQLESSGCLISPDVATASGAEKWFAS